MRLFHIHRSLRPWSAKFVRKCRCGARSYSSYDGLYVEWSRWRKA